MGAVRGGRAGQGEGQQGVGLRGGGLLCLRRLGFGRGDEGWGLGDAREALVEDVAHRAQRELLGALQLVVLGRAVAQELAHEVHLGLDHAELVLAHRVHDQLGVLGVLRKVQGPGLDAALGQVPLVEADLLGLDALQLQQVLSLPHRERVLPVLLLEGEFLLPSAVLHGPVELEPVLLPGTAVHLGVDAHAVLRRADLLVRAVVDGLEPALVVDGLLVAA
ncbi:hypothetical protein a10_08995 [Streptomyces acidiscabies]|nr:hypothetical protein a10_08995 [Streptomyces acidiscabies]